MVLYRKQSGQVVALEDRCPHRQAPLSLGKKEGDSIRCMYHGIKFDDTGKCIEVPGQDTDRPGFSDMLREGIDEAFAEDKEILEGQHKRMKKKPDFRQIAIAADAGPTRILSVLKTQSTF